MAPRAATALSTIAAVASRRRGRLVEPRRPARGRGPSKAGGRPRRRRVGASSAKCSRTTNSSSPRAVESRALARQSIVETGSPGNVAAEAGEIAAPSRGACVRAAPNGRPVRRYLGTSGKACGRATNASGRRARPASPAVAAGPARSTRSRTRTSAVAVRLVPRLGEERRPQDEAMAEHGDEEMLDVRRAGRGRGPASSAQARAVFASASEPRTDAPTSTCSSSRVLRTRQTIHSSSRLVEVDVLRGTRGARAARPGSTTRGELVERMAVPLLPNDLELGLLRPGSRASRARRSGRAGPRAAGRCPRTRSGSRSRSAGTDRGAGRVIPSTVTWCSAIASSSADWVFGIARLISSTSTTFANSGPGWNTNARCSWSKTESPVASVGCRSGVHWIRENSMPRCWRRSRARGSSSPFPARPRAARARRRRVPRARAGSPRSCRARRSRDSSIRRRPSSITAVEVAFVTVRLGRVKSLRLSVSHRRASDFVSVDRPTEGRTICRRVAYHPALVADDQLPGVT